MILQILMLLLTIVAYILAIKINSLKYLSKVPIIIISVLIIFLILILFRIDVTNYQQYNEPILFLLTPAIVALSIPLIKNFAVFKKNYSVILISAGLATISTVLSVIFVGLLFKLNYEIIISIIPKTVTAPVAIEITKILNGKVELTVLLVMFSSLFGAIFGYSILKSIGVKNNLAVGFSLGFISHVLGTASCLERNSLQAAVSTITLILSCISTAIIAPIILKLIF